VPISNPKRKVIPFGVVLAPQIAGWHDGQKATISLDFLNNDAVFHHEQAHEAIYLKTADGFLLSVLDMVLEQGDKVDKRVARRIKATSQTLYESSVVAHEIAATYIGLKMLSIKEAEVARECLPFEYLRYYEAASKVIDPFFFSTNLQVLVLSTVAHFSFGSFFLERFFSKNWPRYKKLRPEYQPTFRLKRILDYLASGKIESLRKAVDTAASDFFKNKGIEPWNLDSEDEWMRAPIAAHLLDLIICRTVEYWLVEQNIFTYLTGDQKVAALSSLTKKCLGVGLNYEFQPTRRQDRDGLEALSSKDIKDFLNSYTDGESIAAARRQSATLIKNADVMNAPYLELGDFSILPIILNAKKLVVVAADPYDEGSFWSIVSFDVNVSASNVAINNEPCFAVQTSYADVMQWLYLMDEGGWKGVEPELLVLSFGSDRRSKNYDTYPTHISDRWNDRSVFYPVGDWASVMETGIKLGGITAADICLYIKGQGFDGDVNDLPTVFLKMIRGGGVLGNCIFRPISKNANRAMAVSQNEWEKQDSCRFVSTSEARESGFDVAGVVTAFGCLLAFWSFF